MTDRSSRSATLQVIDGGRSQRTLEETRRRDMELMLGCALIETDQDYIVRHLSPSAWGLVGLDARAAVGSDIREMFFADREDPVVKLALRDLSARRPLVRVVLRPNFDLSRRVELSMRPCLSDAGEFVGWRGLVRAGEGIERGMDQRVANSHRLLGLMSEALLHRAQDLLMAAQGAIELLTAGSSDKTSGDVAEQAVKECLELQSAFVGFCRTHLVDQTLCLVAPVLDRATRKASLLRGASLSEFTAVQHEDLLCFASEDELEELLFNWLAKQIPLQAAQDETIFVYPTMTSPASGDASPGQERSLAFTAVRMSGAAFDQGAPALVLPTPYSAFVPLNLIKAFGEEEHEQ